MITKYNEIVKEIARDFIIYLYSEENIIDEFYEDCYEIHEYKWVYWSMVECNDRYLSFDDILTMYANWFTAKSVVDYYDYSLDLSMNWKECRYNYYNYTKYINNPEQYKKEEQESLEKSEENLKEVEKDFKNILSKYDKTDKRI